METELVVLTKRQFIEVVHQAVDHYIKTVQPGSQQGKNESERMNSRQAAKFAGVSQATFNKWVKAGRIGYYGSNKVRYFYKSEVTEAIKTRNNEHSKGEN